MGEHSATVGVVVATFRRDTELRRALISLAEQTRTPDEIIVVDDNADPVWNARVAEIVEGAMASVGTNLIYIQNRVNCGSADARNVGISAASSEYITFLDDDDEYLPSKIERQLTHMMGAASDYCVTDLKLFSESGRLLENRRRNYIDSHDAAALLRNHLMHHLTGTDTIMFRREYLMDLGGFPPIDVGDEFHLMLKAIQGGGRFSYLPGCDVRAYVHSRTSGLSSGASKISGENQLHEVKQAYFPQLDRRAVSHISMRHWAVLAYAELRRKRHLDALYCAARSFIASPGQCVALLLKVR